MRAIAKQEKCCVDHVLVVVQDQGDGSRHVIALRGGHDGHLHHLQHRPAWLLIFQ